MEVDTSAFKHLYPFESHYLEVRNHQYHYVDEGAGEVMLLLHGNPTWSFFYRNVILAFRQTHRVIAPDHIGCGLSEKPAGFEYTLASHIDNVDRFVRRLKLENITLVVHDWGGPIGFGTAMRMPERFKRLIVFNTAAFRVPKGFVFPGSIRACRIPGFGEVAVRHLNLFCKAALRWAPAERGRLSPAVQAGYLAPYDSYANRIAVHEFVKDIPLGPTDRSWNDAVAIEEALPKFRGLPMLICWGEKDFVFHDAYLREWRNRFPEAQVRRIPDAGHYLLEDAHERIIGWMKEFIQENPL